MTMRKNILILLLFVTFSMLQLLFNFGFVIQLLLFSRLSAVVRGSHVTTIDVGRFCGADNDGGFGNVLVTGRHTQANILMLLFFCLLLFS